MPTNKPGDVKMIGCKWNVLYHKFCEHCIDGLCEHPKYCNMKTMPFKTEKVEKHDTKCSERPNLFEESVKVEIASLQD